MANIEQNICDAIEVIANNIVSKAGFDKTIQASIISCVDEATGKYKVKYQDSTFYAYSSDVDKKYSKNNRVYVLIPGNDMTRDKTILGIVGKSEEYIASEIGEDYEKVTHNFIVSQDREYQIYSGTDYNKNNRYGKDLYKGNGYTIILEEEQVITTCMKNCGYFILGANFKTNFNSNIVQGNYGLRVNIQCNNLNGEGTYTDVILLDINHGITGKYYDLFTPEYKEYVFKKPDNFIKIESIELFAQNFVEQLDDNHIYENDVISSMYDITINEIGLYGCNSISETVGEAGIRIYTPEGIYFNTGMRKLTANAEVFENGKIMSADANNFYWFRRDISVNSVQNPNYCDIGGLGWACLNNKDSGGNWIPASNNFIFIDIGANINYLTGFENNFKVVSNRETGNKTFIRYERKLTLYNKLKDFNITLELINAETTSLPRTTQNLGLRCNINKEGNFRYHWCFSTNDRQWWSKEFIINQFGCEFKGGNAEIENDENIVENIKLNTLSLSDTHLIIECYVTEVSQNGSIYESLGGSIININLIDNNIEFYTLELLNGNQIFQYDEYGDAPTKNGNFIPQPITVQLIDNTNNSIIDLDTEIDANKLSIEWILPENPTMLTNIQRTDGRGISGEEINYKTVTYTLKSPFNWNNIESNQIGVVVNYNGKILKKTTNFVFLTQGDMGTNGTSYSAIIVPNIGANMEIPKWITFTSTKGATSGYFNFGPNEGINYQLDENGNFYNTGSTIENRFPFKVQLNGGGDLIFDGNEDGVDTRGNSVKIEWGMQILKYDNNSDDPDTPVNSDNTQDKCWDRSNFRIDIENDKPVMKYNSVLYPNANSKIYDPNIDKELVPANILRCAIIYEKNPDEIEETEAGVEPDKSKYVIYASIPIVTIVNAETNKYTLDLDQSCGYNEVIYNRDGCIPRYDNINKIFKINFISNTNVLLNSACKWNLVGHVGIKQEETKNLKCLPANNLKPILPNNIDIQNLHQDNIEVEPVYKFNGSSVTNAILFRYGNKGSYVHIPIDLHLNRFGLAMLNSWDGNSIEINEDGGYVLAPQIGAGKKETITDKDNIKKNVFTGVIMGEAKDSTQQDMHPGLFGYYRGERSFGLFADNGIAAFGRAGSSQIIIDPSNDKGYIYSGNFFQDAAINKTTGFPDNNVLKNLFTPQGYVEKRTNPASIQYLGNPNDDEAHGMILDLTEGHIYFGNDSFHVDPKGKLTCIDGHLTNGKKHYTTSDDNSETFFIDLGKKNYKNNLNDSATNNYYKYFLYCRNGKTYKKDGENFSVTKDGKITANLGKIGGFYISNFYISSSENISKTKEKGKSIITLSTNPFDRDKMNIVMGAAEDSSGMAFVPLTDISELVSNESFNEIILGSGITLGTLLFATGDDFGVTENGSVFSRNIFSQGALFTDAAIQNLYIKGILDVLGTASLKGDLTVSGNLSVGRELSVGSNISANGDITIPEDKLVNVGGVHYGSIITTSSNALTISCEVFQNIQDDLLTNGNPQLPWMTYSNTDSPPTSLANGHIFLVYEN